MKKIIGTVAAGTAVSAALLAAVWYYTPFKNDITHDVRQTTARQSAPAANGESGPGWFRFFSNRETKDRIYPATELKIKID